MTGLAIAADLGTSGLRAQALDLSSGEVLSTAITTRHPLPGLNVIDHIHFALELGVEAARDLMVRAVDQVIAGLGIDPADVSRLCVCGNPAQLSLFQGLEIRDLAFAGSRKLEALGIVPPERSAAIRLAADFPGLHLPADCAVIIPPAVRGEVGADALALILRSGILDRDETAIAIDYGTNAEMALVHRGRVFTGSAAAGPALEGQHIVCGTLAVPGAIADLEPVATGHRLIVLDATMTQVRAGQIDLGKAVGPTESEGPREFGVTGTGTIAALDQALEAGLIALPRITTEDRRLHLGREIYLTEQDLAEAGKAIGAIRAGYLTLCAEAGIGAGDIETAYLAGASGTYVDARKAQRLGLVPPRARCIRQVGNTSLAMARELAVVPERLEAMSELASSLRETHCMFASSRTFTGIFLLELSHWTEGMPMSTYRQLLGRQRLEDLPPVPDDIPRVVHTVKRDIDDLGRMGLTTIDEVGVVATARLDACTGCLACVDECPTNAISVEAAAEPPTIALVQALCNGVACRRCEAACPSNALHLESLFGEAPKERAREEVAAWR